MSNTDFAFDNPNVSIEWVSRDVALKGMPSPVSVPDGVIKYVPDADMDKVAFCRRAKEMGCADVIISARRPDGVPVVLLSKRKRSEAFGGKWWVYGGSLPAYGDVHEFISGRAEKECGFKVTPQVLIGFYRTSAPDYPQSTMQPCFGAVVPFQAIERVASVDQNHDAIAMFTYLELVKIASAERHWYPIHVAEIAIHNMPSMS